MRPDRWSRWRAGLQTVGVVGALLASMAAVGWVMGGAALFAGPPDWTAYRDIRRVLPAWKERSGPVRRVVDVVCLVPDLPTYVAALSTWDRKHYFPILIEDDWYAPRFLRAFRPARVVRYPRVAPPVDSAGNWEAAVLAVGRTWQEGARTFGVRGDAPPPRRLGACPPGVVVASSSSPLLAGAAALAAGRFQPLVRWEPSLRYADRPGYDDARKLANELEERVAAVVPRYRELGDDCDFLTLAADYPYRYQNRGDQAFDDLLARVDAQRRWGYAGRLVGSEAAAVYQAMCSLFLQPRSALFFNGYTDFDQPGELEPASWGSYSQRTASRVLSERMTTTLQDGLQADLPGWKAAFGKENPHGLVFINSSGGTDWFNLRGERGKTDDVPESVPAVVYKIHSFSAASPHDPKTLAGRWLQNGAYIYFGAMNEPYLRAFRTPTLVSTMLAEGVPFAAAMRRADALERDTPWRLVYLGDPLYRLETRTGERLRSWKPIERWPKQGAAGE